MHNMRVRVKFYLGQHEDCGPGDSISDSSEKLHQRAQAKVSMYVILAKREHMQSSTYFFPEGFC